MSNPIAYLTLFACDRVIGLSLTINGSLPEFASFLGSHHMEYNIGRAIMVMMHATTFYKWGIMQGDKYESE